MFPFDSTSTAITLLFVEDDPIARETASVSLRLTFPFLTLYVAENGAEGLELYRQRRPDIVLTDIKMPVLDGIGMARDILALNPRAQIIVTSGHSDLPYLMDCIRLGIRRYVLKPLEHKPLFEAVSDCVTQVELERQLASQEQYIALLSRVVEQSSHQIAIADRKGAIRFANARFLEFTGYGRDEVASLHLRQLHFQDAPPQEFEEIWSGLNAGIEWRGEGVNRKKTGESYHESVCISPITDSEGEIGHFVAIREDVTAKMRSREEMDRAQKLESLGVLAGGIAHDFNNILTGVLGNISFAQAMTPDADRLRRPLDEAEKAALRAAELTRQLLTFAHGGKPVKQQVSLRQLVEESVSLALRGGNVQGEVAFATGIDAVEVDEGQMKQAFSNVLINALQAMPGGGRVSIGGENVQLPPGNELGLPGGNYVRLCFADRGCGVAEEIRGKIFDPYFSTRPGGSGLGLASTHSIVARHGGHIGVESTPGCGASFICHLPSTGAPFKGEAGSRQAIRQESGTGERVLVMDDEGVVRKIAGRMLECLGYRAESCSNGEEALALYAKSLAAGDPFFAVLMDLTVPGGMGGKEAAQALLALDPGARLVVSSGYFDDPVMADYRDYGFSAVLPKPYMIANLSEVMCELKEALPAPPPES